MNTIPISVLIKVLPGVLAIAGSAQDLTGLVLSSNTALPIGAVTSFASAADATNFFGAGSTEDLVSQTYFNSYLNATKTPAKISFTQYPTAAVGAWLRSAKLNMTLAALKLLTGTLTISSGGTPQTSGTIVLTAATSFSNAATIIAAAFTSPPFTVSYDALRDQFVFTNTTTGAASSIGYATGTLADGLNLGVTDGATLSQGADAATPFAFMSQLVANGVNFATFSSTFEPALADKLEFSRWTSLQTSQYSYVGWDSDANALLPSPSTAPWGAQVQTLGYDGTVCLWGASPTYAAAVQGYAASLDFALPNGRTTVAYRTFSGLTPAVTTVSNAAQLDAYGYNYYGVYATGATQYQWLQKGSVSGQYKWLDSYLDQIWIRSSLTLALANLLANSSSIPYNDEGYNSIRAACQDPINAALTFGAIRAGVTLSASQVQAVNQAVGANVAPAIQAAGFYLRVQDAPPSVRVARGSPPITLYYTDGQSIQAINMSAIEIQ